MRATSPSDLGPHLAVGVDGTDAALRAVRWVAVEARERGLPLLAIHAAPYAAGGGPPVGRVEGILARARTVARHTAPGLTVHTVGVPRSAVGVLREAADRAELLALGAIGTGLPRDGLADALTLRVAGHTTGPVVVVHHSPAWTGPVLVGVEDPRRDAGLIAIAHDHAHRHGVGLQVVHASRMSRPEGDDVLDALVRRWDERSSLVDVVLLRTREGAAHALLARARDTRLIVVGPGKRRAHVLAGSTTRALVRAASCPVLVAGQGAGSASQAPVRSAAADPHLRSELW